MRVPIRKPGKYVGKKPDPHITSAKYRELENKLARLKASQPRAIGEVKRLALDGDFSENAAYSMAKGRLRGINRRIDEIEEHLKRAIIIERSIKHDTAALGSIVRVKSNGQGKTFQILGSSETNPGAGIISQHSPIGSALLGHKVGDKVQVVMNNKTIEYKIVTIN